MIFLYIIGFILITLIFMFIEENIVSILLFLLIVIILGYIYSVYEKSSNGQKKAIKSQIKKEEKLLKKNEESIKVLTELKCRLNNLGIYPTRIITHKSMNDQIIYVDENNKKMYLELLYEKYLINTDEIIDFELVENKKQLFKYTLNTALTGQFKIDETTDYLRLIIYLDNKDNPVININCLGALYSFNRNEVIYNSQNFAYEIIAVLKSLKSNKSSNKKFDLIPIIPDKMTNDSIIELEEALKNIKSEPFLIFLKKYYGDKWKNNKLFRIMICLAILILIIIIVNNVNNNILEKKYLSLYEKVYTPEGDYNGEKYILFHKNSIEVAFKKEDETYYYRKYEDVSCNFTDEFSSERKYTCKIDKDYEITVETSDINDCATIYGGVHYDGFNYNDGSFRYCPDNSVELNKLKLEEEDFCKDKGILCRSKIDKESLSGFYITKNIVDRENFKAGEAFSIIYIDEASKQFIMTTRVDGSFNYMDFVEDIDSFDPKNYDDKYIWEKNYKGFLVNNEDGSYTLIYNFYYNNYEIKIDWNKNGEITIDRENVSCSNENNNDCNILTNDYTNTYVKYK